MAYESNSFDDEIVRLLKSGTVGLLPTDTIYGLSCRALDKTAVKRIHKLKDRDSHKPFIILISDIKMLDLLSISKDQAKVVEKFWPGALSIIFGSAAPSYLTLGTNTLAVRLSTNSELRELIDKTGPLISTSANVEGGQPAASIAEAQSLFGDKLDFYVDTGELNNSPSTLAKINNGRLEVIRQGAVKIN